MVPYGYFYNPAFRQYCWISTEVSGPEMVD